ncbi:5,10-methylenetetrahydrofolate reductase (NAD(P)) [Saccharopolyspora erythraea NRRL 2338]|uniref:Methylenetetrahydrofolate reductase n=2 Tax=Saccharopolyspora erythraea TaxID=1836 RepID=A4FGJ1_SACEN|nr:methylenetetrahydrofolate reductase [Saccharopolyspora erythraea]EQD83854.1 5,10-methylenetetrahydrofolate reductase [Saccharopolyspora erythraea D]PFG96870.1 5,10-methylenetetrahydrofolate reductase (NAD(P)) [Saccharopolyspora erythraea NRRL 2338]QRK87106.1 methylenetetrahydrofolate reductase [Saccharopolyspora erythraea]CAM03166.1 5,10-methylenetetrahydrofolate reductase [Saccharopolyspora erythraea NRRL 2338]
MTRVVDRLRPGRTVFSVEFFPPKSDEEERLLWKAIREFEALDPAYVSVTYGAGGSSRDRTVRTTGRIAGETTLLPMAHLTGVNHSIAELRQVIGAYAAEGIRNVLVIRGDPPGDPMGEWIPHPEGITYADELVRLVRECGDFCVGVAAFPHMHPRSADLESDTRHMVAKLRAGADFSVAQMFLEPEHFLRLRDRLAQRGCHQPLLPGIMPITTPKVLGMTTQLSNMTIPSAVSSVLDPLAGDPAGFRAAGIEITTKLCEKLIAEGVPALHFYSLNRAQATREVVSNLGLSDGVLKAT